LCLIVSCSSSLYYAATRLIVALICVLSTCALTFTFYITYYIFGYLPSSALDSVPEKTSWLFRGNLVNSSQDQLVTQHVVTSLWISQFVIRTLRHQDISASRQFGTSIEWCRSVSRQFGTRLLLVPNCPDISAPVPKYLETHRHHPSKMHIDYYFVRIGLLLVLYAEICRSYN